jgi:hypothetical protein
MNRNPNTEHYDYNSYHGILEETSHFIVRDNYDNYDNYVSGDHVSGDHVQNLFKDSFLLKRKENMESQSQSQTVDRILKNYSSSEGPWFLEKLFINLKVLSKLKTGQKLYVNGDVLSIEDIDINNVLKSLIRWWYSESRLETLKKVQEIVQDTIDCGIKAIESEELNKSIKNYDNGNLSKETLKKMTLIRNWEEIREKELHMDNKTLLQKLINQLEAVTNGIKNLEETYNEDVTLCSKLELEIELIERALSQFEDYLKNL